MTAGPIALETPALEELRDQALAAMIEALVRGDDVRAVRFAELVVYLGDAARRGERS